MQRYTSTAIALHWLMAVMIIANFTLGVVMVDIPGLTPTKLRYFSWHKWAGVTILLLATVRLLWRLKHPAPPLPDTMPRWEKLAANGSHLLLYVLLFAVPLSGYFYTLAAGVPVVYFGVIELPVLIGRDPALKEVLETTHFGLNLLLAATVAVHVLAALKHQFIDRDSVLRRMLPVRT
ncbi:MAG TPA: cytochrome b [Telluria sp.]|nr:cytochrome b [Telluria sp.]